MLAVIITASLPAATLAADSAPEPLDGLVGDAIRGEAIVRDRALGNCLICHRAPIADEPFQGDIGPDLTGVGSRLTVGQLRYRLIDTSRLNPDTLMPPYHRVDGLSRVDPRFAGRPALSAQQIEDVVAWLAGS